MRSIRLLTLSAAVLLVVAACSSAGSGYGPASSQAGSSNGAGVVVSTAKTAKFGTVLTGPNGMTLYTHTGDSPTPSTCTGSCATAWPPLATSGQPTAGTGVSGQLATAIRGDGSVQVTYDGLPLYYWQGDAKIGDVTGDGIEGFSVATVSAVGALSTPSAHAPAPAAPAAPAPTPPSRYGY